MRDREFEGEVKQREEPNIPRQNETDGIDDRLPRAPQREFALAELCDVTPDARIRPGFQKR